LLRSHARIDPVTKPAEGAKDQEPDQKPKPKPKQKQKQKPDQKIAAFGSSYSWIRRGHREIGRLSGRLREQARSHKSKSKAAQLPAAKPHHSTMSASSSAFDLRATSEG
jgi:outer membrane biosynthesis protein TonB